MSNSPAPNKSQHIMRLDNTAWNNAGKILSAQGFSRAAAVELWFRHLNGEKVTLPQAAPLPSGYLERPLKPAKCEAYGPCPVCMVAATRSCQSTVMPKNRPILDGDRKLLKGVHPGRPKL